MTPLQTSPSHLRRALRVVLMATSAALAMGLALSLFVTGPAAPVAAALLWTGLALLTAIPVLNVVGVLIDEWRRDDRRFAAAAIAVLVLLAYTTAAKLGLVARLLAGLGYLPG